MSIIDDFVSRLLPQAQSVSAATGLPVDFILAQSGFETNYGQSYGATARNNYFGIMSGSQYASYDNPAQSFAAYGNLVSTPRYSGCIGLPSDSLGACLNQSGYTGTPPATPDYGARLSGFLSSVRTALGNVGAAGGVADSAGSNGGTGGSNSGVSGNSPNNPGQTGAGNSSGWFGAIGDYITRAGYLLLAIVIVGVGIWMLSK